MHVSMMNVSMMHVYMMHACRYDACIYDAANFVTNQPTDKAILGVGNERIPWHSYTIVMSCFPDPQYKRGQEVVREITEYRLCHLNTIII